VPDGADHLQSARVVVPLGTRFMTGIAIGG
jgi:hypothetical protein